MNYPKATKLKSKGAKIFKSNAGLKHNQFVTLHNIVDTWYIILDSDNLENYPIGQIEQYSDYELEEF
jgi:hypothetical protein